MRSRNVHVQVLVFALVGIASTGVSFMTLIGFVEVLQVNAVIASVFGYAAGMVINYILNYRVTFTSIQSHLTAIPKYFSVVLSGWLLNTLIMYLAIEKFGLHYLLSQVLAVGMVMFFSFTAYRLWAFAR